jgi:drug/metabolite transporter (DMT)-like permease
MVYLFGLAAALLLAAGFVLQQHSAAGTPLSKMLSPRLLVALARRPAWLAGIAAMIGGQIFGAVALDNGSLTVVEPLLAANLLFALPLAAAWTQRRLGPREYVGAVVLIIGLAIFMVAAGPASVAARSVPSVHWLIAGLIVVGVVGVLVSVAKRTDITEEATLLATGAGLLFGLQDALTQRALLQSGHGWVDLFTAWQPYALVAVAATGLVLGQSAFAAAPLPASLPAITIAEPICGIGLGAGLFAEHIRLGAPYLASEVMGMALMVIGVFFVARSPIVTGHHRIER